jgi:hypothetical protein
MPTSAPRKAPIKIVCAQCYGDRVLRDAWASWDEDTQRWELHNVFDHAICEDCDGETTSVAVPIGSDDGQKIGA